MSLLDTENLPHKCRIQRRIRSLDAYGGSRDTVTVEQRNVPCWEQQASASEVENFRKRGMSIDRKIFFPTNPNVTNRHQIVITEREDEEVDSDDEIVLEVKSVNQPDSSAGFQLLWKVMVNQLTGEDD